MKASDARDLSRLTVSKEIEEIEILIKTACDNGEVSVSTTRLSPAAERVLKEGGFLVEYCGVSGYSYWTIKW
jgi:hypothetical protein